MYNISMVKMLLTTLLLIVLGSAFTGAQALSDKSILEPRPKISQPLPFKHGETLTYDVGFSKLIFSGTIGELKLWVVSESAKEAKEDERAVVKLIEFRAEAVSKGFFSKLFGVKVRDRFNSLANPADFGVHSFTKNIEEGKVRREQKSVIDRKDGRVTYTDRDLANTAAKPLVKEKSSPPWIQDVLSAIYYMRTQEMKDGAVIPIPISDAGEVYNIELVVTGKREEIKVDAGRFKTVLLDAKIFDGRYIRRSGEMKLWLTDDARRIPVRARVKTSGATLTVSLKRLQEENQSRSSNPQKE
jgi:hypothetical protein